MADRARSLPSDETLHDCSQISSDAGRRADRQPTRLVPSIREMLMMEGVALSLLPPTIHD